jgi:protein Mpv17
MLACVSRLGIPSTVVSTVRMLSGLVSGTSLALTAASDRTASFQASQITTRMQKPIATRSIWTQHFRGLNNPLRPKASSNSTPSPSLPNSSRRNASFVAWYESHLYARPVVTKMFTGSLLWGIGDAVAQIVPFLSGGKDSVDGVTAFTYDWPRTTRAAFFGFAIHAPLSHLHFNFLEWMTIRLKVQGLAIPIFKAFMEQFVYWSWFSNSLYHGAMGAMQGQNASQIYDRIANVLWETQLAQWKFWIPIQLVNFQFTPVRHQLNVVLVTSIAWTALLSAWYPPETIDRLPDIAAVIVETRKDGGTALQ